MKCLHKHIARMAAALCLLPVSCVKEMPFQEEGPSGALYLQPGAVELTTKTAGDDDRGENALGTYLDVFFTGNGHTFWKEYHLTDRSFASAKGELLSVNWRADGFDPDKDYNVYVLVNGPDAAHGTVGSLDALRAITVTDADIYRLQQKTGDRAKEEPHAYTSGAKRFVMDGWGSWRPDGNKTVQTIDMSASLRRAAAKIVLNVSYDADFLAEIIADEKTPQEPRFKLNNYATCSAAITDGDAVDPAIATTGGWRRLNGYVEPAPDHPVYNYSLTTYSYAFSWGTSAAAVGLNAPYIILSVPLGDDPAKVVNHYYRIPVRPQDVYSLERNTIYTINVVLNSLGSYKEADAEIPVNLSYQVLEWTKIGSEITNVETEAVHFFQVSPTEVALRGDGAQSQTFRYYAPTDASITIEAIPTDELDAEATARSFETTQTVGGHGYQALYIDKDDNPQASSVNDIVLNTTAGTITVTSTALANRASKYIRFRVWYDKGESWEEYQDIYIRHFPTDNISSIPGWYSYKYDGGTRREYSWNPEADGWGSNWDGYEDNVPCPDSTSYNKAIREYRSAETPVLRGTANAYYRENGSDRTEFLNALSDNDVRAAANSFANAQKGKSGKYANHYYYGLAPVFISSKLFGGSDPKGTDYYVSWFSPLGIEIGFSYYHYSTYHRVTYLTSTARRYYRDVPDYSWVRWIPDSVTPYGEEKNTSDNYFQGKVYDNDSRRIYLVEGRTASTGFKLAVKNNTPTNYTNNHMYVVQMSQTNDDYTVGFPVMTDSQTSNDHTVSPAFMLASQLGVTAQVTDSKRTWQTPAVHCSQYVEVSMDGKVYDDWRLPTKEEISIIFGYQTRTGDEAVEISTIFTAHYYSSLDGDKKEITPYTGGDAEFIRCVRDLTPAEVEALNKIK